MASTRLSADARRALIVDAAVREFGRNGYAGATTDAIARDAGISQPYVIRLFGTKRALFEQAMERVFDELDATFTRAAQEAPQADRLRLMGAAYPQMLLDRDLLLMQLQAFAACGDPEIRAYVAPRVAALRERVRELTGADDTRLREFMAMGMLLNVVAVLEDDTVLGDTDWHHPPS